MTVQYIRLVNQQQINRSILIDKIDRSQSNFTGYAQRAKQKIYVPYANPVDPTVKGYIDLTPTDEVLLSVDSGTIAKLIAASAHYPTPLLTKTLVLSTLTLAPSILSVVDGGVTTTITGPAAGATFVSQLPDKTYLLLTDLSGVTRKYAAPTITIASTSSITIPDVSITGGPLASGWKVQVLSNSKYSNIITIP